MPFEAMKSKYKHNQNQCRLLPLLKEFLDRNTIPHLTWIDKNDQIWQLPWKHHRPTKWCEPDAFMLCEIARKMYDFRGSEPRPEELKKWKERLRNALRSLGVKELKDRRQQNVENPIKVYQFSNDPVNGRKQKGTTLKKNDLRTNLPCAEASTASVGACVSDPYSDSIINASFRSRSPVSEFHEIDTDGFSGDLNSEIFQTNNNILPGMMRNSTDGSGIHSYLMPAGHGSAHSSVPTCNVHQNHSENSFFADIESDGLTDGGEALIDNIATMLCNTSPPQITYPITKDFNISDILQNSQTCMMQSSNIREGAVETYGMSSQADLSGNIPNIISGAANNDSSQMDPQEWSCSIPHEPALVFDYAFQQGSRNPPFISLVVNYFNKPVVAQRITSQSVKLCFIPNHNQRNFDSNDARLVLLPPANECPGLDRSLVQCVQKILNHMEKGIIISYKGDDIYAERFCKAVPFYGVPRQKNSVKMERMNEVKIFDFNTYVQTKLLEGNQDLRPCIQLTFSVTQPDRVTTPPLSVVIWHIKANDILLQQQMAKSFSSLEPDCSLSNEFDERLKF